MKPKPRFYSAWYSSLLICLLAFSQQPIHAQGKVLINEYLPWPNNACGTTAEFIELMNFGPGPMDIGCYIITDGDYSITIPPNTILQPGQFYVLAGQASIPQNCGNDLRAVTVNLNWTTCGCTSGAIPVSGDGFLTDGGNGNEQIVLLDPSLKIVDAVIRDFPAESSSAITTSTMGGSCTPKTFDLDTMNVPYETIGESTGRGNSMAREIDGGCRWIKDTQESAGDPNNTTSSGFDLDASLSIINAQTCSNTGSASISVLSGNLSQIFPVQYVLAKDIDSNNVYNVLDTYNSGTDSTASVIPFTGLTSGRYKVVIGTAKGCDLTPFNFLILDCGNVILSTSFLYFKTINVNDNNARLVWNVGDHSQVSAFEIERSEDGISYHRLFTITSANDNKYREGFYYQDQPASPVAYYRIRMITAGKTVYSAVQKTVLRTGNSNPVTIFPNPVTDDFLINVTTEQAGMSEIVITDKLGKIVRKYYYTLQRGQNNLNASLNTLPAGIYFLYTSLNQSYLGRCIKIVKGK
jgi:Lamin Tail Domain/Secretion system C-terminal sorting domain